LLLSPLLVVLLPFVIITTNNILQFSINVNTFDYFLLLGQNDYSESKEKGKALLSL